MKKNLLGFLFLLNVLILNAQTFTVDHIEYTVTDTQTSTVEITDYTGSSTDVVIPSQVTNEEINYSVISIGRRAFNNKQLTNVVISENIISIEDFAFAVNQLTSISLPKNLTRLGEYAFAFNKLTNIEIPESLRGIGFFAFKDNNITSISLHKNITHISDGAFSDNQLASIEIPENLRSIGHYAFSNNNLTSIFLPKTITSIGLYAFAGNQLTSLEIPENITWIGNRAFSSNNLTNVISLNLSPPTISPKVFENNDEQISLKIPSNTVTLYLESGWTGFKSITDELGFLVFTVDNLKYKLTDSDIKTVEIIDYLGDETDITTPSNVTYNGNNFSVTNIGNGAFQNKGLTSVAISENITSIGSYAFYNNNLTNMRFQKKLHFIGDYAFGDNQLKQLAIPNNVETIGKYAFADNKVKKIVIGENIPNIGPFAFAGNNNLNVISSLSKAPKELNTEAFTGLGQGIFLDIPMGMSQAYKEKGWDIFQYIYEYPMFMVDNLIYYIKDTDENTVGIANYLGSETDLVLPNKVTHNNVNYSVNSILYNALSDCNLDSIKIPEGIASIGILSITGNNLSTVTLPSSITYIAPWAFSGSLDNPYKISDIISLITNPPVYNNFFPSQENTDLKIPAGTKAIYQERGWTGFKSITELESLSNDNAILEKEIQFSFSENNLEITTESLSLQQLQIINMQGAIVLESTNNSANISSLSAGMYILYVTTDKGTLAKKFVKP